MKLPHKRRWVITQNDKLFGKAQVQSESRIIRSSTRSTGDLFTRFLATVTAGPTGNNLFVIESKVSMGRVGEFYHCKKARHSPRNLGV